MMEKTVGLKSGSTVPLKIVSWEPKGRLKSRLKQSILTKFTKSPSLKKQKPFKGLNNDISEAGWT
jgi:hypothetical protein